MCIQRCMCRSEGRTDDTRHSIPWSSTAGSLLFRMASLISWKISSFFLGSSSDHLTPLKSLQTASEMC